MSLSAKAFSCLRCFFLVLVSTLCPPFSQAGARLLWGLEPRNLRDPRLSGVQVVQLCSVVHTAVIRLSFETFWSGAAALKIFQIVEHCGTGFPLSLGQQSLSTRLQETTIPTNTIQTIRYRCSPIERLLMIIMFATTTDGLQHFSAPSAYYYHSHTHTHLCRILQSLYLPCVAWCRCCRYEQISLWLEPMFEDLWSAFALLVWDRFF